ncbi:MAG: MASE1 domain-containing protein [Nitrospinae bacterium]|nr:MASE1 domain-containing protein [Nitrospinota bacterium]
MENKSFLENKAVAAIVLGGIYILVGRLGTLLALPPGYATAVFPASGIALAGVLCLGYRVWPGILFGSFFMNLWISIEGAQSFSLIRFLPAGIGIGLGAAGEAVAGAYLYRRLAESENPLSRTKSIVVLILFSAGLSSAISASMGATSLCLWKFAGWSDYFENWITWWLGDAIGILIVATTLLAVVHGHPESLSRFKSAEAVALLVLVCLVSQFMLGEWWGEIPEPVIFLIFPLLVLVAFRLGQIGAVAGILLVSGLALWRTVHGAGPFVGHENPNVSLLLLQTFLGVASAMTFILSASITENRDAQDARKRLETELKDHNAELERRVRERTEELERSNKDLAQFAYVASHDLQEPLRKIVSFADLMKGSVKEMDAKGWDCLGRIEAATRRMQDFIHDLLEYSRATVKTKPFAPADLGLIVKEVLVDLENQIRKTQGQVRVGHLPTLMVDKIQIQKVFQNLISNALKYHRAGTPPAVNVSGVYDKDAGYWEISVEDNGIGFDEKYADRIFKPFERLHGRSAYEGTGIGLAICEKIIARHHGKIAAKSVPGQGSTFTVALPDGRP